MPKKGELERQYFICFLGEICLTDRLENTQVLCVGTASPDAQQHVPRVGWGMRGKAHDLGDGFCALGDLGCCLGAPLL